MGPGTRASSEESQDEYDNPFDPSFAATPNMYDPYAHQMYPPPFPAVPSSSSSYSQPFPYEIDVKTERQMFINDIPTRRDSTISTFSTLVPPPPPHAMLPSYTSDDWAPHDHFETWHDQWSGEEGVDFNYFDFPHVQQPSQPQCAMIPIEDCDRELFDHLLENVLPLLFPILEANQHGSVRADVILPALENNKAYLHSCLLAAATHMKATKPLASTSTIDDDVMRHKLDFVTIVVNSLNSDTHHMEMLDALLGMISLQCCVGRADDLEKELIPWHQHFQAAADLVQKLNLPTILESLIHAAGHPPFNMTLTAWIDILGSTMLGKAPRFANTYRNKHLAGSTSGLAELMGCHDGVMYLLSEVACLDSLKLDGKLDDIGICSHITSLAQQLDATESQPDVLQSPYSKSGAIRPRQLSRNITAIFRKAARVYLCSLVPDYNRHSQATVNLIAQMADMLQYIPSGPGGFDRCLVWPMLICGAYSIPASPFRRVLAERVEALGDLSDHGSFGRMVKVLHEVWRRNDELALSAGVCEATPVTAGSPTGSISTPIAPATSPPRNQNVHWRDVMQQNGWEYLLI